MRGFCRTALSVFGIGVVLASFVAPSMAQETPVESSNVLVGRIFSPEGAPMANATVRAYHLGSGRVFSTVTTPETGSFILSELPDGSFEISVEMPEGSYFAPDFVNISGGVRALMSFSLRPGPLPPGIVERITRRGLDPATARGLAKALEEQDGKPFLSSPGGVATIILSAIGGGFLLDEALEDDDKDGSPSLP